MAFIECYKLFKNFKNKLIIQIMLEILQYVLGGFWRFIGFAIILYLILHYVINGIVEVIRALSKRTKSK